MKTLVKEHGLFQVDIDAGQATQTEFSIGYRALALPGMYVSENYFDLAGMSLEEKTLFFDGATVQNLSNPSTSSPAAGQSVIVTEIMTAVPLTDKALEEYYFKGNFVGADKTSFEQTIYARNTIFVVDIDFQAAGFFNAMWSHQIGSLSATASDRVYTYRLIIVDPTDVNNPSISCWPCRYILRADAREEAEYQYLMRLKRSYELQNEPDND